MKKLLLALAALCALTVSAAAEEVVILTTNDVHCAVEQTVSKDGAVTGMGYPGVAAYREEMEAAYGSENVVLVDAGDAIQGGTIGTLTQGEAIVTLMEQTGYDLAIPGNHEFDYGMERFLSLAERAAYPYLCANLVDLTTGETVFSPYATLNFGDTQVAFVGIATPASIGSATPAIFQNEAGEYIYDFCQSVDGQELYAAVQSAVDAARAAGAEYVIAVAHLGIEGEEFPAWTSTALVENTRGIDALVDGHSHSSFVQTWKNADGEPVSMLQTGSKLAAVGKLVLDTDTGAVEAELVTDWTEQDAETSAVLADLLAGFEEKLSEVVAAAAVDLTTLDPETGERAVRRAGTNLADFCADAYRVLLGADVAVVNGGGVRADIPAGDVTYGDIISVHPFNNELYVIEVTGADILAALEMGVRLLPYENGSFLHVSGITYTVDPAVPSSAVVTEDGTFLRLEGRGRVREVTVGGEPLDEDKTYTLASIDHILFGGGGDYAMFQNCPILRDAVMLDNAALIRYADEVLGGIIGSGYENPRGDGRVTIRPGIAAEEENSTYTVRPGDCLWRIAARELGSGARWQELYQANRDIIANPNRIWAGMELKLFA